MHSILNNHNRRLLDKLKRNSRGPHVASCKSRSKEECPLDRQCNSKNVLYQACIFPIEHNIGISCIDISAGNWKQGLYNHRHSFSNQRLRNPTTLSKYFWKLKDQGLTPSQIKWKIVGQSSTVNSVNGRCNLCIDEKISIIILKIADYC